MGGQVRLSAAGALIVQGREVFPIAFTMPPPADGMTPDGRNALRELRDAGATFIRTGPMGEAWDDQVIAREERYLDAAAKAGLRCLVGLRELGSIRAENDPHERMLRRIVTRFKDHPGMGGWKGADEPEWGRIPAESVARAYRIVKEMDEDHPVWVVQAPRGTVQSLRAYGAGFDITGADIYPVGYPPGAHSLGENKEISMVGDYTRKMMEVAGVKPVWMTLQIAWSGVTKPGKTLRFPTFAQERFMTYQAIINGARGIVYFGGHIPVSLNDEDRRLGWNWTFWRRVLRPVVEEIGTGSPLAPALVAPASKLKITADAVDVELCARETEKHLFILACKREGKTVQVKFTGLPPSAAEGQVLFEEPRRISTQNGAMTDWFAPFDVHVYRFEKKGQG
jgi:hypothetical protein